jgi:hypothetical protein
MTRGSQPSQRRQQLREVRVALGVRIELIERLARVVARRVGNQSEASDNVWRQLIDVLHVACGPEQDRPRKRAVVLAAQDRNRAATLIAQVEVAQRLLAQRRERDEVLIRPANRELSRSSAGTVKSTDIRRRTISNVRTSTVSTRRCVHAAGASTSGTNAAPTVAAASK